MNCQHALTTSRTRRHFDALLRVVGCGICYWLSVGVAKRVTRVLYRHGVDLTVTEKIFQSDVMKLAKANQWLVFHTPPYSPRQGAWRSAGKGFPDLLLVHPTQGKGIIFAELKTEVGSMSQAQEDWAVALIAQGAEWYLWRPSDWDSIV